MNNSFLDLSNSQNQFYRIQPHDISALIGSNITIPCVIAQPHGDVQWTKDGLALGEFDTIINIIWVESINKLEE